MKEYIRIESIELKEKFDSYIKNEFKIDVIDYIAIGFQNKIDMTSASIMSNSEWQDNFCRNHLYNYDPIRRSAFYSKKSIIPFCEIDCIDNAGIFVMNQRIKYGIKNGLLILDRTKNYNIILTLGTSISKFDTDEFINKNNKEFFLILNKLKYIAIKTLLKKDEITNENTEIRN